MRRLLLSALVAAVVALAAGPASSLAASLHTAGQAHLPDVSPEERRILMEFFAATGGPSWTDRRGWGTSASVCEWYGVMCDFQQPNSVTWLHLPDNNLRGTIPASLADLRHLGTLDVSGNHLSGAVPEPFLRLWDEHRFEFSGWGNTFSSFVIRATVISSASSVLCAVSDDVRYRIDVDGVTRRARFESVRCVSADIKSRKTYCLVREGTAPPLERVSRALQILKYPIAAPSFDYPFTAVTHGEYLTTTVEWGDNSKQTIETYDRQGPLDVWIAQQVLLGMAREISWSRESRTAACIFEK